LKNKKRKGRGNKRKRSKKENVKGREVGLLKHISVVYTKFRPSRVSFAINNPQG